jgi:hypothetical protein
MKKSLGIAIAAGMMLLPWAAFAQSPLPQPAAPAAAAAAPAPAASAPVPADQQPSKEQLLKLFEVMRVHEQFQNVMKMIPGALQQQLHAQMRESNAKLPGGAKPTPAQQAKLEEIMSRYMQKTMNIYTSDEAMEDMIPIYQRHISRTDVDGLIAFYGSQAGQHLLDAQPAIMREYMPVVMQRVMQRSKELTGEMAKEIDAYVKSIAPSSGAAANPAHKPAAK